MVESYEDKVDKLYLDMYVGQGKNDPSITTRLATMEERHETLSKMINKLIWLVAATCFTTLSAIIAEIVQRSFK